MINPKSMMMMMMRTAHHHHHLSNTLIDRGTAARVRLRFHLTSILHDSHQSILHSHSRASHPYP